MSKKDSKSEAEKKRIMAPLPEKPVSESSALQGDTSPETPAEATASTQPDKPTPDRRSKESRANYSETAALIIRHFGADRKRSFSKKEIVAFCESQNLDIGNWTSLHKHLARGTAEGRMKTVVNRGPRSTYKIMDAEPQSSPPRPQKTPSTRGRRAKKPAATKGTPRTRTKETKPMEFKDESKGVILSDAEMDERIDLLTTFVDTLLIKEVSREEILRFFDGKGMKVGDWELFVKRMAKGNKKWRILSDGAPGAEEAFVMEPRKGTRADAAKTPTLPEPVKDKPRAAKKQDSSPVPVKKAGKPVGAESKVTTLRIPAGDNPVSITIKIEIG